MVKRLASLVGAKASNWAPNVFQFAALALITAGFWVASLPAGLIVAGLCVGLIGWAVDK